MITNCGNKQHEEQQQVNRIRVNSLWCCDRSWMKVVPTLCNWPYCYRRLILCGRSSEDVTDLRITSNVSVLSQRGKMFLHSSEVKWVKQGVVLLAWFCRQSLKNMITGHFSKGASP